MPWIKDQYEASKINFLNSNIQIDDKNAVCKIIDKLLATGMTKTRASKYFIYARLIIERGWLRTYCGIYEEQLYHCLSEIEHNPNLGAEAKRDYKITLKRILEYLDNPLAKIIKTTSPQRYLPRFFLTVHDILKMARSPWPHLRDKAMAVCLFESNCRPHEFFTLGRNDVRFELAPAKMWDGNGGMQKINLEIAYLNLSQDCKTGARAPPLIFSVPWLKAWLDVTRDAPGESLWSGIRGAGKGAQLEYPAALKAIRQLSLISGITNADKVTLYSFRHGRNTEVSQYLSNAQQCEYAGWYQGSDMPRIYNHLAGTSMVAPLLSPFGIVIEKSQSERQAWIDIMKTGQKIFPGK